ncbi:PREDICTED: cytochrome P450 3A24-like isoform X2 [Amphimedon queenslandica]|uniref:Cytochrome P450 n=1 Tax=Amphimedon queenslandica TaxID=400682 RepID=A0AAN0J4W6_AMPQE|nr:PREDICTED: cytochrome P450 3A24-like isoform X2 [Amphimedon queenslandica]|eukprot:XP_019851786.1 PREDICTED: cytochrome P450 3A24-like isoform X2 [Amphimedon queenslandica]
MFFAYLGGIVFLIISFLFWYKFIYSPYQFFKKFGLHSPPTVPFFGNIFDIFKLGSIYALEKWSIKYGKVFGYYIGAQPYLAVLDPDILKEIMIKKFDNFTERKKDFGFMTEIRKKANINSMLLFMNKQDWKRTRAIITPTFSTKKLKMISPHIERSCDTLVEIFSDISRKNNSAELWRIFGQFSMEVILATAFGCQVNILKGEENSLTEAAIGIFTPNLYNLLSELCTQIPFSAKFFGLFFAKRLKLTQHHSTARNFIFQVINQRRLQSYNNTNVDFLQLLMEAKAEDDQICPGSKQLTDEEIISVSLFFLLAGYETTSNLLGFTAYLLAMNPDKQDKLTQEINNYYQCNKDSSLYDAAHSIEYLDRVINESQRIYAPGSMTFRECENTCTINGVTIPAGCTVMIPIQILHRLVEHWEQPEIFRPERFSPHEKESHHPMCFMPFGAGPRNCIGMKLALMEAKMCLTSLMRKYKFERAPDTQVPLKTRIGITQSPVNGIFLRVLSNVF